MSAAWSYAGFNNSSGFNTNLTSPIDGCPEDNNPFTLPSIECLPTIHDFMSELPAGCPDANMASDFLPSPQLLSFGSDVQVLDPSYACGIALSEDYDSNLFDVGDMAGGQNNVCCSETTSLVQTMRDTLQEHILSSTSRLQQHVYGNPLSDQFCSMSAESIAATGIRTLKSLLAGERPPSALDAVCFVHLIYAFCLVTNENGAGQRSKELFLQSVAYATDLNATETDSYMQVATLIWKPDDVDPDAIVGLQRSLAVRGKEADRGTSRTELYGVDALLNISFDFLDGKLFVRQLCD
jgi:hypothetical protein